MTAENTETTGRKFERLVDILARLRAPGGCPWDREQTFDTIKPYLLEETYEVLDAIDALGADERAWSSLAEELGDLLLQAVFFAQMAAEEGRFSIADSLDAINSKLVRRHPHIFAGADAATSGDVKRRWEEIKTAEKKSRGESPAGLLASVPRNVPALAESHQIATKVAHVGFDWRNTEDVLAKVREELDELSAALAAPSSEPDSRRHIEHEIGDLLGAVSNLARHLDVDSEQALRKANLRFRRRFAHVEAHAQLPGASLDEMEALWQQAKLQEPGHSPPKLRE